MVCNMTVKYYFYILISKEQGQSCASMIQYKSIIKVYKPCSGVDNPYNMDGFPHFMWRTHRLSPHRLAAPISLGPRLSTRLGTWAQELLQWTRAPQKAPEPCWSTAALEWWTAPRAHLHHRGDTSLYVVGQLHFNSLCPIIWPDCTALCFSTTFTREKFELLYCTLLNKVYNCR